MRLHHGSCGKGGTSQLALLAAIVILFHGLHSFLTERVFMLPWFDRDLLLWLSFVETASCAVLTLAHHVLGTLYTHLQQQRHVETFNGRRRKSIMAVLAHHVSHSLLSHTPLRYYVLMSILMSASLFLTNTTSLILSYPVQVVFKSSKLLCAALLRAMVTDHHQPLSLAWPSLRFLSLRRLCGGHGGAPHDIAPLAPSVSSMGHASTRRHVWTFMKDSKLAHYMCSHEFAACLVTVGGLILFMLATTQSSEVSSTAKPTATVVHSVVARMSAMSLRTVTYALGFGCIITSNLLDALLYILEEMFCLRQREALKPTEHGEDDQDLSMSPASEIVFWLNFFASLGYACCLVIRYSISFLWTSTTDPPPTMMVNASSFDGLLSSSSPTESWIVDFASNVVSASVCSTAGTLVLLKIIEDYNSTSAVLVTTLRKMITVVCSYLVYRRSFSAVHLLGLMLVMTGVMYYEQTRRRVHTSSHKS